MQIGDTFWMLAAWLPLLCGALLIYAGAANQQLVRRALPPRRVAAAGTAAIMTSLVALLDVAGPAAAAFVVVTGLMLVWSIAPVAVAWWRHARQDAP